MQGRRMLAALLMLMAVASPSPSAAADEKAGKSEVYNHVTGSAPGLDRLVHQVYDATRRVIDVSDREGAYVAPQIQIGPAPRPVVDAHGTPIQGKVTVFFIVKADGHVEDPMIVQASDRRLGPSVLEALAGWVFDPARWKGQAVAVTAGEEFTFVP